MVRKAFVCLLALFLPIFFLSTNIRLAVNSLPLYNYCFNTFRAHERLGLTENELNQIGKGFIRFFNDEGSIEEIEPYPGFFNEKEKIHLQDIRNLIKLDYKVWRVSGIALLILALILLVIKPKLFPQSLIQGGIFTIGIFVALLPFLSLLFDRLFLIFHKIAFSNPYWMLDPLYDRLALLFPPQFFQRAAVIIALGVIAEASALGAFGWLIARRWSR